MIRQPLDSDLPALISLWQEAFGDSEEEAAFYFRQRHQHQNMLVWQEGEQLAGMLSMLPLLLQSHAKSYRARYVYAVATARSHRGQGISTRLLEAAHQAIEKEGGMASVLVPAEPSLFDYYAKRGYHTAFMIDQLEINGEDLLGQDVQGQAMPCSAFEYAALRDKAFVNSSLYARWDEAALRYISQGVTAAGGAMLRLEFDGLSAAAVLEPRANLLRVVELVCAPEVWHRALALIHQKYGAQRYQLRLPQGSLGPGRPFGMIRWLADKPDLASGTPPYLAFAKD